MIYYLLLEKVSTFYKQEPNTDILCLCNNKKWPSKFLNLGIVRVVQLNLSIIETRRTPIRYPRQTYCLTSNNFFFTMFYACQLLVWFYLNQSLQILIVYK